MTRLTPLPIERLEGVSKPATKSPFPVLGTVPASNPGVTAAQITGSEVQRMDQLEKMLKDAQGRAEIVEREAYDKAYVAGEKAGLTLGEKRAEQIIEAMEECLKRSENEAAAMRQSCVDAVVDISQLVVEQLVGELLEQQKETLFKAAKRAAEQLPEVAALKVVVNPDDLQTFERLLQGEQSDWRLYADPSTAAGTCRLVSKHQDAFVDPIQAVADSIRHIRVALHGGSIAVGDEVKDSENTDPS